MARTIFNILAFACSALFVLSQVNGNNLGDKRKAFKSFINNVKDESVVYYHKDIEVRVSILQMMIDMTKELDAKQGEEAEKLLKAVKELEPEKAGYAKFTKAVEDMLKVPTEEKNVKAYEAARDAYPALYEKIRDELVPVRDGITSIFIFKIKFDDLTHAASNGMYALAKLHKYKQSLSLLKFIMNQSGMYLRDIKSYYGNKVEKAEEQINALIPELTAALKMGETHEATVAELQKKLEAFPKIDGVMKKINCLLLRDKYAASKNFYEVDGKNMAHQVVKVIEGLVPHIVAEDRPDQVANVCVAAMNGFSASSVSAVFGVAAVLAALSL